MIFYNEVLVADHTIPTDLRFGSKHVAFRRFYETGPKIADFRNVQHVHVH